MLFQLSLIMVGLRVNKISLKLSKRAQTMGAMLISNLCHLVLIKFSGHRFSLLRKPMVEDTNEIPEMQR